jgi:hypothetical protein
VKFWNGKRQNKYFKYKSINVIFVELYSYANANFRNIELESSETSNCHSEQKRSRDKSSGIKLLSTSTSLLTVKKEIREKRSENLECERRFKRNRQIVQVLKVLLKF